MSYGKGQHQAVIKEVVTIPRDPVVPLSKPKGSGYRAKSRARSRSKAGSAPPLEDWDLETDQNGTVRNYVTKEEEDKRESFRFYALARHVEVDFGTIPYCGHVSGDVQLVHRLARTYYDHLFWYTANIRSVNKRHRAVLIQQESHSPLTSSSPNLSKLEMAVDSTIKSVSETTIKPAGLSRLMRGVTSRQNFPMTTLSCVLIVVIMFGETIDSG